MTELETAIARLESKVAAGRRTLLVEGAPYGVHHVHPPDARPEQPGALVFAEDDCGNPIAVRRATGEVLFVDHETGEITVLSSDLEAFVDGLVEWRGPELEPGQVLSAWIHPDLVKQEQARRERGGSTLIAIKVLHTVVWAFFVACIAGIYVAAWADRLRLAAALIGVVLVEVAVLAGNRMRCPLTDVAARHTDERADNFDIYLPLWLARYNKEVFGTLFILGIAYTLIRWLV